MDLRSMECYLAVVEEGSITRAAQRLHMSQPPLTVRMKSLEAELGVALLFRHGRGVEPTAAGRVLADRARRLLADVQGTTDAVRSIGHGVSGTLAVEVGSSVAPGLLANLLTEPHAQAPGVALSVLDGTDDDVGDRVSHAEADAGLIHLAPREVGERSRKRALETAVAVREPLVAILRADHPSAREERADLVTLTAETLIVPSRASAPGLHAQLLAAWASSGGNPEHVRETESTMTTLALVQAGLGITMIPAALAKLVWRGLQALPLRQHHPAIETAILWRRDASAPGRKTSGILDSPTGLGQDLVMSPDHQATPAVPSLVESLKAYIDEIPEPEQADALHQVFYGFYTRVAIIDRSTHALAAWANSEADMPEDVPDSLAEALRDSALFVGQELFASRMRAMSAMGYVSSRLAELLDGADPVAPFTLTRAVAFDQTQGRMRTYDLSDPGAHPDLPYDPLTYDPHR
jgi:DNA-binding transcriptional LysR family regulator